MQDPIVVQDLCVTLAYDNRTGRPRGLFMRALSLLPPVGRVQDQAGPYADFWQAHNADVLTRDAPQVTRRVIALGDSLAQGVGGSSPEQGWIGQVLARLHADGLALDLVNLSATGARVPDVISQQIPLLDEVHREGDLVAVMVGSNDLFAGGKVRSGLPLAFDRMLSLLPHGSIVATLPQPRRAARAANRYIEAAASTGRVRVVDLRVAGPSTWNGKLASDRFHPNDAGYAGLADAFEPVVRGAL